MSVMQDVETVLGYPQDCIEDMDCFDLRMYEAAQRLAALVRELMPGKTVAKAVKRIIEVEEAECHTQFSVIDRLYPKARNTPEALGMHNESYCKVFDHVLPVLQKLMEQA